MKVIYHDKTGRHLPVVAAALHLKMINENLSLDELEHLPYFLNNFPEGTLLYMGLDAMGNEVYILGRKSSFPIIRNAYLGLNQVFKLNEDFIFASVQPFCNLKIKTFDFLYSKNYISTQPRFLNLNFLFQGIKKAMPGLNGLVFEVKMRLNRGGDG